MTVKTVYDGKDFTEFNLSDNVLNFATNKELVLQYMENSRRISNPENFNADGTIKKGKRKEGNTRLDWNFSRNYYKNHCHLQRQSKSMQPRKLKGKKHIK